MKKRKRVFSITARDLKWDYFRAGGKGGQKQNKTNSGVRCTHEASGGVGEGRDAAEQKTNKRSAFKRMTESRKFKSWMSLQRDILLGNIKYEEADRNGNFVEKKLEVGK